MTKEQNELRKQRIREAAAARTPEQKAAIAARRAASRALWTEEQRQAAVAKRLATSAAKSEEEKAATKARRQATRDNWTADMRAQSYAHNSTPELCKLKSAASIAARVNRSDEDEAARRKAIAAAKLGRTEDEKRAFAEKVAQTWANHTPEEREAIRKRRKEAWDKRTPEQERNRLIMANETKLERYGTDNNYAIARKNGRLLAEEQVRAFFASLGINAPSDYRLCDGKQLDGLSREPNVAFEYNGLFFHCEDSLEPRDQFYHRNKMDKCRKAGVRLFSIFEDEWLIRQGQVKSFLRAALGKNNWRLAARKTEVREIEDRLAQEFYEQYHIQGRSAGSYRSAGLFIGEDLVACMTFGQHPHQPQLRVTVLTRLCFKTDVTVVGGSAKLFKFLLRQSGVQEVISWSDNRWSEGGVYKALGFALDKELPPDYQYVDLKRPVERISKQSQQKQKTDCPSGMTELQWAKARGLSRIWDCGKIRWKWSGQ